MTSLSSRWCTQHIPGALTVATTCLFSKQSSSRNCARRSERLYLPPEDSTFLQVRFASVDGREQRQLARQVDCCMRGGALTAACRWVSLARNHSQAKRVKPSQGAIGRCTCTNQASFSALMTLETTTRIQSGLSVTCRSTHSHSHTARNHQHTCTLSA